MKTIRWTAHALQKITNREVDTYTVEHILEHPDTVQWASATRQFYQGRYFDETLNTEMLLRVLVDESDTVKFIITLYKTSKFKKYEADSANEN